MKPQNATSFYASSALAAPTLKSKGERVNSRLWNRNPAKVSILMWSWRQT